MAILDNKVLCKVRMNLENCNWKTRGDIQMKSEMLRRKCSIKFVNYVILAIVVSILCLFNLYSSPIRNEVPDIDSSVFQIMGKGLLNKQIIYKELFDHKGPVVYLINVIAYIISPSIGLFMIETVTTYIGALFIYKLSKLFLNDRLSLISSIVYLVPIFSYITGGNFTEEYAIVFTNIALYNILQIFLKNEYNKKSNWIIIGVTFAINLMIKPTYVAIWVAFGMVQLICSIKDKKIKELLKQIIYMLIGILVIMIPILIYLVIKSDIKDFIDAYIVMNMKYSKNTIIQKIEVFGKLLNDYNGSIFLVLIFISNLLTILDKKIKWRIKSIITIFNVIGLVLMGWAANSYSHYLIQFAPIIALNFIILVFILKEKINEKRFLQNIKEQLPIKLIYFCFTILTILLAMLYNRKINIKALEHRITYNEYKRNYIMEIGKYLSDTDELFVLGNDVGCYVLLDKQPRFKYFFQTPIFMYDRNILIETEKYVEKNKPKVILKAMSDYEELFDKNIKKINEILSNEYEEHDKIMFKYYVLKENVSK